MTAKPHHYFIDIVRIISFLAVVLIHVTSATFSRPTLISHEAWTLSMALTYAVRFATPLFIMVSGYLFLNSEKTSQIKEFYMKRGQRVLIPLVAWNIIYYFFNSAVERSPLSFKEFFTRMLYGGTYYHLYFLFLITGLYILTPHLKKLIEKGLNLNVWVPSLILLSSTYFYLMTIYGWYDFKNSFVSFIPYIGYFLAGAWVPKWKVGNRRNSLIIIFSCILIEIVGIYLMIGYFGQGELAEILGHRLSILVAIPTLLIFHVLAGVDNEKIKAVGGEKIRAVADLSMGVYLIHPIFARMFTEITFFKDLLISYPIGWVIFSFICTTLLSIVSVYNIRKILVLRQVF